MIEVGKIHKIDALNRATVRFPRKTACENCRMCLKPKDEMYAQIVIKNTLNAKVGDNVSVEMGDRAVLTASFLVYVVPIILLGLTLYLARNLPETISFIIAIAVLVASFAGLAVVDRFIKKNKNYLPKMCQIVNFDEENEETVHNLNENKDN